MRGQCTEYRALEVSGSCIADRRWSLDVSM